MIKDLNTILETTKKSISSVVNPLASAPVKWGDSAVAVAQKQGNNNYMFGGGFETGDIVHFPSADDLNGFLCVEKLNSAKSETVSLLVVVERGEKLIPMRAYTRWFNNSAHKADENGNQTEDWWTHEGRPFEDAVAALSAYDLFKTFAGKTVKVDEMNKRCVRGLIKGAKPDANGVYGDDQFTGVLRKFYKFSYVE